MAVLLFEPIHQMSAADNSNLQLLLLLLLLFCCCCSTRTAIIFIIHESIVFAGGNTKTVEPHERFN